MREVSIYLVSGIPSMQRKSGYVAYCLEYYSTGSKYPVTLTNVEEVEEMTGRHAELVVLLKALKRLNEKCILSIYTESEYLDMGIGERRLVDKWQENDWKDGKMLPIKNADEWRAILERLNGSLYRVYLKEPNAYVEMLREKVKMKGEIKNVR